MTRLTGSCLCGAVRYEIEGGISPMGHCHCRTCRKTHGAPFSTTARVPVAALTWRSGEEGLRAFESSPGKRRYFCGTCGSHVVARRDGQDEWILRLGCLDGDPGHRPRGHIWTSERATWYEIPEDGLPRFPEGLPARRPRDVSSDG